MFESLYPIKFKSILKEKIWGGRNIADLLNKKVSPELKIGESWEISGLASDVSIVSNGFLKGNSIQEIVEIYMGDLVGEGVYEKFGIEFPLLIKFIDASDLLSIQVHPDDEKAIENHHAFGKTEMWYILKAREGAELINGFKHDTDRQSYMVALNSGNLHQLLNVEKVQAGEVFFIPPGRVHAICDGILLAEIQQTSDITYRIYDWGRLDNEGNPRELHNDLAIDVIDFKAVGKTKTNYDPMLNKTVNLVECQYFKTNLIEIDHVLEKDYNLIDSFIIYMCIEGCFNIEYERDKSEKIEKGECVLIPAILKNLVLIPSGKAKMLEVYIPGI